MNVPINVVEVKGLPGGLALRTPTGASMDPSLHVMPLQSHYFLPLVNYQRDLLTPKVIAGDHVKGGEILAAGVIIPHTLMFKR